MEEKIDLDLIFKLIIWLVRKKNVPLWKIT